MKKTLATFFLGVCLASAAIAGGYHWHHGYYHWVPGHYHWHHGYYSRNHYYWNSGWSYYWRTTQQVPQSYCVINSNGYAHCGVRNSYVVETSSSYYY
jgi:hypothetical protein